MPLPSLELKYSTKYAKPFRNRVVGKFAYELLNTYHNAFRKKTVGDDGALRKGVH